MSQTATSLDVDTACVKQTGIQWPILGDLVVVRGWGGRERTFRPAGGALLSDWSANHIADEPLFCFRGKKHTKKTKTGFTATG